MSAPPHVQLVQMAIGAWLSRLIVTAAELNLADHLAAAPLSAEELAPALGGAHVRSLHRFLRTLANFGLLEMDGENRFALTPLGDALRSDAPGCARSTILALAGGWMWSAMTEFRHSVETGQTAFEKVHGAPIFTYLSQHPDLAAQFSQAMIGIHGGEPPAVAAAYDFPPDALIADVGGATGNMLAHILERHASASGLLYDQPHVVTEAPAFLNARGVAERVRIESGSFFETVPAGADFYILSHIIHDWSEDQCLTILSNCRAAMSPAAKLLIVEFVLPEGNTPHFGKLADMIMLSIPGGEERTASEYAGLLGKAGFRLTRVIPTTSDVSIVEAEVT